MEAKSPQRSRRSDGCGNRSSSNGYIGSFTAAGRIARDSPSLSFSCVALPESRQRQTSKLPSASPSQLPPCGRPPYVLRS